MADYLHYLENINLEDFKKEIVNKYFDINYFMNIKKFNIDKFNIGNMLNDIANRTNLQELIEKNIRIFQKMLENAKNVDDYKDAKKSEEEQKLGLEEIDLEKTAINRAIEYLLVVELLKKIYVETLTDEIKKIDMAIDALERVEGVLGESGFMRIDNLVKSEIKNIEQEIRKLKEYEIGGKDVNAIIKNDKIRRQNLRAISSVTVIDKAEKRKTIISEAKKMLINVKTEHKEKINNSKTEIEKLYDNIGDENFEEKIHSLKKELEDYFKKNDDVCKKVLQIEDKRAINILDVLINIDKKLISFEKEIFVNNEMYNKNRKNYIENFINKREYDSINEDISHKLIHIKENCERLYSMIKVLSGEIGEHTIKKSTPEVKTDLNTVKNSSKKLKDMKKRH